MMPRRVSPLLTLVILVGLGCGKAGPPAAPAKVPPTITTQSGVEMVLIPAGSFDMGNKRGRDEEKPVHKVWIDSFLMDRHEVTQAEFEKLGKVEAFPNPSHVPPGYWPIFVVGNLPPDEGGFHQTKQGLRYTISEPARREVLARLLKLNHERYAEEGKQGLHGKSGTAKKVAHKKKAVGTQAKEESILFDREGDEWTSLGGGAQAGSPS